MTDILLGVAEQQHAQHRGKRRDHQPRDAHAVVHVLIEQVDHHGRRDQQGAAQVVGQQVTEPAHQAEERPELQHQQYQHQPKAAEDGMDEPFLAFTEQTDAPSSNTRTLLLMVCCNVSFDILTVLFWNVSEDSLQALSK